MEIMPNPVMSALSAIPFLVTILGLYFIIFKPMLQYLDDRLKAMEGGAAEAQALEAEAAALQAELDVHNARIDQIKRPQVAGAVEEGEEGASLDAPAPEASLVDLRSRHEELSVTGRLVLLVSVSSISSPSWTSLGASSWTWPTGAACWICTISVSFFMPHASLKDTSMK